MIMYLENEKAITELRRNDSRVSILISITKQEINLCTFEMIIQIVIIKNGDKC